MINKELVVCPDIDRFQRDKRDPSVIVFSEIKRCQRPHSTQFFQKAKIEAAQVEDPFQKLQENYEELRDYYEQLHQDNLQLQRRVVQSAEE